MDLIMDLTIDKSCFSKHDATYNIIINRNSFYKKK